MKDFCINLTHNRKFEFFITIIILVNSILIGVQTTFNDPTIDTVQAVILLIFTFEIIIRFIAAPSVKAFFTDGWNVFDLSLVLIGYIPASLAEHSSYMMALRVLRVFRVLRLLRSAEELKLIVTVLVRSMASMVWNLVLFLIFVYLYAIVGVSMFKLPNPDNLNQAQVQNYQTYLAEAPNAPSNSPDPYGNIGEAIFTLFRLLTGEDWTDLRYNLITAEKYGLVHVNSTVITTYHVSWFCLAAFLLLNLVTGAVLNNYQMAIQAREKEKQTPTP